MHYTPLGRTGLKVSVAGLGCGGNSRLGLGTLTRVQSADLVRRALDAGINFIDTAMAYGTEEIVGDALVGRPRDQVVISTKSFITSEAFRSVTTWGKEQILSGRPQHRVYKH